MEQAIIELLLEYVKSRSSVEIQRHIGQRLRRFTSPKANNIIDLFSSFDISWEANLRSYLVDEYKDAVDGVVDLRHSIAHGRFTGVTMLSAQSYYDQVKKVVDHITELCLPT